MKIKTQLLGVVLCLGLPAFGQAVQIGGQVQIGGTLTIQTGTATAPLCQITLSGEPNGQVGVAFTGSTVTTSNCTGTPTFSATGLPTGTVISSSTGVITGIPTTAGTYNTAITAKDQSNPAQIASKNFSITIASGTPPPPSCQINTATEPGGTQNQAYTGTALSTSNCTAPLAFTVSAGALPAGTSMTGSNGQVTGTPTVSGAFNFTALVTDHLGATNTLPLTINIATAPPPLPCKITTTVEPQGTVSSPYTGATLQTANCTAPLTYSTTNTIPGPLTLNSGTGVWSGTPTTAGNYPAAVTVTDSSSPAQTYTANLTIQVNPSSSIGLNPYCNTSEIWTGTQDGVALPNKTCVRTAMADTPVSGRTVNVTAGSFSSLQSAINGALCGDTIVVPSKLASGAQAVYSGSLSPATTCTGANWIIVESDQVATMPEGQRVTPAWAGIASFPGHPAFSQQPTGGPAILMPQIISSTGNDIATASGASHWRFIGLELTTPAGAAMIQNPLFHVCLTCDHIIFDRGWIHGGNNHNDQDLDSVQAGFHNDGTYAALQYSTVTDIHCITATCVDNYAIYAGGNNATAAGPVKAVGNFLEAAGECYFNGGGGVGVSTKPAVDLEFRQNHCFKPLYWYVLDPSYIGTQFVVKNHVEMKNGQRALFEGNIFDQVWEGQADQFGEAVNLGSKNQASGFSGTASSVPSSSGGGGGGAASWSLLNTPAAATTIDGFDIRQSNNEWYIADRLSGHYYKTTNQGSSWTDITSNIPTGSGISALSIQVNPNDGSLIVGGGNTVKFWRSTNDGSSWTQLVPSGSFAANPIDGITGCALPLASGGNLVCGGYFSTANHNTFYSTDNGVSGTVTTSYTPLPGGTVPGGYTSGITDPFDGSIWTGSEAAGLWKSTNGGVSFTQVMACINSCASGTNGNIYGLTFTATGNPVVSAQGGIYIGAGSGFSYTWTKTFTAGNQGRGVVTDPNGAIYFGHNGVTGSRSVYQSLDNGNTFQPWDTGVPTGLDSNRYTINNTDGQLYAVFFNDATNAGFLYRSPVSGSAPPPTSGIVTWISGPQQFSSAQTASTCAVPGHCEFKLNGITYLVQSVTDSTHLVVAPNPGTQTSVAYTAYLTGLNPSAIVSDLTWRYNYFTHAARCMTFFTAASDGGDISTGTYDMEVHDNVCDDISTKWSPAGGCCFWASGYQVQNTFGAPNNMHDMEIHHTTVLSFQNAYSYGNGNGGPSMGFGVQSSPSGGVPNLKFYDNLGTAGWTGSASPCTTAGGSVLARFQCYDQLPPGTAGNTYCFDHNFLATTTQGSAPNNGVTSVSPYPGDTGQPKSPGCSFTATGNTFVGSFAAFQFTNLNSASGGNYLLQNTSPAHNGASDGTDAGANIPLLNQNIAGVQ